MTRYLIRRAVFAVALVFIVSSASVWLVRLAPGDFVTQTFGARQSRAESDRQRARLGLDRSPAQYYARWIAGVARFDLGRSFIDGRDVGSVVLERAANTAVLATSALVVATVFGIVFGTLAGARPGRALSRIVGVASLALLSMPPLMLSLLLVFFAARTQWLPVGGMRSALGTNGAGDLLWHLIAPTLALALPMAASFERLQAKAIAETLSQPFVLAARARGLGASRLLWRCVFKPSLRSVASVSGLAIAALFSGSFAVEAVSAWPGLGRLMLDALQARDLNLVGGCALAGSVMLAASTLVADAVLVIVDPRASD